MNFKVVSSNLSLVLVYLLQNQRLPGVYRESRAVKSKSSITINSRDNTSTPSVHLSREYRPISVTSHFQHLSSFIRISGQVYTANSLRTLSFVLVTMVLKKKKFDCGFFPTSLYPIVRYVSQFFFF